MRKSIARERKKLWQQSNKCCFYCDKLLTKTTFTADHVQPRSKKGKYNVENLVLACRRCNEERGNISAEAFKISRQMPSCIKIRA